MASSPSVAFLTWILTDVLCCLNSMATVIDTSYGPVRGFITELPTNKTAKSYLGIPFAKAERFEYPAPPNKWTSVLFANKTDKICPQPNPSKRMLMSEDCLLLNVYIPGNATNASALAVMLWFHGGAFILGDTLGYDGSVLATEGNVIVVTAAYRLGVLGFLSANSGDLSGNYGLLDQVSAMKWVNKNIERFGGDPNKVTIFGGSAGAMCVALLMLSPLAGGLYQNVILQSGTAVAISSVVERNEADSRARSFAKALGCTMDSLKACAKVKTIHEILDAQVNVSSQPISLPFGPVVDGHFLPGTPDKLLQDGQFNNTNIIVGITRDEGSIFISGVPGVMKGVNISNGMPRSLFRKEITDRLWVRNQNPGITDLLIYEYTDWSNFNDPYVLRQQFIDINSDATFRAPAVRSADVFFNKGAPTYFYQLEKVPKAFLAIPFPLPPWFGVYHRAEIPFVFGNPLIMDKNLTTAEEIGLSKEVITMWTNFAKTGNPNAPTAPKTFWPQYTGDRGDYLGLSPNMTVRYKMRPGKMALWNEFLPSLQSSTPTMASNMPTTPSETSGDHKDLLITILATLTGAFGALAVILLVLLILSCRKRRNRGNEYEEAIHM